MSESGLESVVATHVQELRRGTVVLGALAACDEPQYGYALLSTLGDAGMRVEANTLYPLLRRLEKQGLLEARWDTDDARPRKYYTVTDDGRSVLADLVREWDTLAATVTALRKDAR